MSIVGCTAAVLMAQTDWPGYSKDSSGDRYSTLSQINTKNVSKLKPAWQYGIDPAPVDPAARGGIASTEAVPIMVGGVVYTPTAAHTIVALEPETGKELWKHALGRAGAPLRGVAFWPGDADSPPQILAGTSDGHLIALNAKTGNLVPGFGDGRFG